LFSDIQFLQAQEYLFLQFHYLLPDGLQRFLFYFFVLYFPVLGNAEVIVVVPNLFKGHKEAFCFPVLELFCIASAELLYYVGDISLAVNEGSFVVQAEPIGFHIYGSTLDFHSACALS